MPFMVEATSLLLQRTLVVIAATVKSSAAELKSKQLTIVVGKRSEMLEVTRCKHREKNNLIKSCDAHVSLR
jgi:hypothetical protein